MITEKEFRHLIARIIEGTAVPRSIGALGSATEPWDELREKLCLFGYSSTEEIELAITTFVEIEEYHE